MDRREFIRKGMLGISTLALGGVAIMLGGCSSASAQEKGYYITDKCVGCHKCLSVCRNKAIETTSSGLTINQSKCVGCGACYQACPHQAIVER